MIEAHILCRLRWVSVLSPQTDAQTVAPPIRKTRSCKCLLAFVIVLIIILIAAGAALAWYFLGKHVLLFLLYLFTSLFMLYRSTYFSFQTEYRVWVLEPRVQQQYTAYLSILNRNFSADLSSHSSPTFKKEAKGVQSMVSRDYSFLWYRCTPE